MSVPVALGLAYGLVAVVLLVYGIRLRRRLRGIPADHPGPSRSTRAGSR